MSPAKRANAPAVMINLAAILKEEAGYPFLTKFHIFSRPSTMKHAAKGKAGNRYRTPSFVGLAGRAKIINGVKRQIIKRIILWLVLQGLLKRKTPIPEKRRKT